MSTLEEGIKANRERMAKRRSLGEENRKRFEKEVGGPAFKKDAKSEEREAELRHARLSNMRNIVPSLSGQHHKVHAPKAKSKALEGAKEGTGKGTGIPKSKWGPKTGNWHKIMPGDR